MSYHEDKLETDTHKHTHSQTQATIINTQRQKLALGNKNTYESFSTSHLQDFSYFVQASMFNLYHVATSN